MDQEIITSEWLAARLKSEWGLQVKLARHLGLRKSAVHKMAHNQRRIRQEEAAKIRAFFAEHDECGAVREEKTGPAAPAAGADGKIATRLPENIDRCLAAIVREFDPDLRVLALRDGEDALVREAVEIFIRLYAPDPRRARDAAVLSELFGIEDLSSRQAPA